LSRSVHLPNRSVRLGYRTPGVFHFALQHADVEGLTVLKADDAVEARAIMDEEPLIKAGLRRYELKLWRVQEGSMSVTISGVHGTATIQ
jgi:hypothetical protein